ncbi:hypothetical protein LCGC14_0412580 [marine sediment metagenome]|uniref:Uncharacterized protein n=1 Tax=marine sediment metagenome TaxID=412755 RepID=A0A0F9TBI8_9ZZZZ
MTSPMTITFDPSAKQGQRITSYAVEYIGDQERLNDEPIRLFNVVREFYAPWGYHFPVGDTIAEETCRRAGIRMPPD